MAEKATNADVAVAALCKAAGVSDSGYYVWRKRLDRPPTPSQERRGDLSERVCEIFHAAKGRYGYRRIHTLSSNVTTGWCRTGQCGSSWANTTWSRVTRGLGVTALDKADGTLPAGDLIRREFNATEPGVRFVGESSPRLIRGPGPATWRR